MALTQYRVSVPFRGVAVTDSNAIVSIPNGAILRMIDTQAVNTFVTVWWDARQLLVFEQDLFERAVEEPLNGPLAAGAS